MLQWENKRVRDTGAGLSSKSTYTRVSIQGRTKDLKTTLPPHKAGDAVDHLCGKHIDISEDALPLSADARKERRDELLWTALSTATTEHPCRECPCSRRPDRQAWAAKMLKEDGVSPGYLASQDTPHFSPDLDSKTSFHLGGCVYQTPVF